MVRLDPRPLGISAPEGKDVHQFRLRVTSGPSIVGMLFDVLHSMNIDVLGIHGQVSDDKQSANLNLYVEMGGSKWSTADVIVELRRKDFVLDANSEPRSRVYFDSMNFPLTSGREHRVIVLSAKGWAALINSLLQRFGSGVAMILQAEGVAYGEELAVRIGDRFSSPDALRLVDNLEALFSASGLGILEIEEKRKDSRFEVRILEPIVAVREDEKTIDHFLIGVVRGALGKIYSASFRVKSPYYRNRTLGFELFLDSETSQN